MEIFIGIFYIVVAAYAMPGAIIVHTSNIRSAILFKVIPFAIGLVSFFLALRHYGFIVQL